MARSLEVIPRGRQEAWDLILNSQVYPIARNKEGLPSWEIAQVPEVATKQPAVVAEQRDWMSWHSGYGWFEALAPNTYHRTINGDARFPRLFMLGPKIFSSAALTTQVNQFFEQSGNVYVLDNRYCRKLTFSYGTGITGSYDTVAATSPGTTGDGDGRDFVAGNTPSAAINFDGVTVIGFSSDDFIQKFDGTTWTASTTQKGVYFAKLWKDTYFALAGSQTPTAHNAIVDISQNTNPTGAAWANGPYTIGETTTTINGMVGHENNLYIVKTDGLYGFDRGLRTALLIPAPGTNANNGKGIYADSDGTIWYPTLGGLFRYDSSNGTVDDCTPARGLYCKAGINGRITAMARWRNWIYAAMYNGTHTYIMAGRPREANEPGFGPYIWHGSLADISSVQILTMFVTTITTYPLLLMGGSDGKIYWFRLAQTECPLDDANYHFTEQVGKLFGPMDNWGIADGYWDLTGMAVDVKHYHASNVVGMANYLDNSGEPGQGGSGGTAMVTTGTDGRNRRTWTSDLRFTTMQIYLELNRAVATTALSPIVKSVSAQATRRVSTQDFIQTTIICDDRYFSHFGIKNRVSAKDMITNLKALSTAAPVTLKDYLTGSERSQTALVMPPKQVLIRQEGYDAAVFAVQLGIRVLA